jgi:phage baseplate assembly protein W
MNDSKLDRAWGFRLPARAIESEVAEVEGIHLNSQGGIAMVSDGRAVRQAILILLATRPGERVMRPEYGCWLHRLVFAPNDAGTAGLAIHFVREALERWEPRAVITRLNAGADLLGSGDPAVLDILLEYRVRRTGWEDQLALGYNLHDAHIAEISAGASPEIP